MNNLFTEKMSELNRKKVRDEIAAIRLEEEAGRGQQKWPLPQVSAVLDKNLSTLGNWMVARGEKLRKRHAASLEKGSTDMLQGAAR